MVAELSSCSANSLDGLQSLKCLPFGLLQDKFGVEERECAGVRSPGPLFGPRG